MNSEVEGMHMNLNPLATAALLTIGLSVTAERRYTAIETFNYRYVSLNDI